MDALERNAAIEKYRYLVPETRKRMTRRWLSYVDPDDIDSAGYVGLIHAVDSFRPDGGATLKTWCICQIRHSIKTEIRANTFPRSKQARFEVDPDRVSFDSPCSEYGTIADTISDPAASPYLYAVRSEEWEAVFRSVLALDSCEREIILRYYGNEQSSAEIARLFRLSEQRIYQLRVKALRKLRKALEIAPEMVND